MSLAQRTARSGIQSVAAWWAGFLLLAVVFGLSHGQFPLYYFVQNQHFFHGLTRAGVGLLRSDWLAGTADVWPVFSVLVDLTYRYVGERTFYAYYILLMGVYIYSLLGIAGLVCGIRSSRAKVLACLTLITIIHTPVFGYLTTLVLGWNAMPVLVEGVASQRILYDMLQPSAFGSFLLLSIYLFLRGKLFPAIISSAVAAAFHPVYILIGAALNASYLIVMRSRGDDRATITKAAVSSAVLLLPMALYMIAAFFPTSLALWTEAQSVLVNFRIPRHALVSRWLDGLVWPRVAIVIVGIFLARGTALATVMLLLFVVAVGLTIVQVITGQGILALMFPWRLSVVLVPLATTLIIARIVSRSIDRLERWIPRRGELVAAASVIVLVMLMVAGAVETLRRFDARVGRGSGAVPGFIGVQTYTVGVETSAVMNFVRDTRRPGQVYLIPLHARYFRLYTGAPVYVDFWYIPYNDVAVMEWYRRVNLADAFYQAKGEARCAPLRQLAAQDGVTHVVVDTADLSRCGDWRIAFDGGNYRLYARGDRVSR